MKLKTAIVEGAAALAVCGLLNTSFPAYGQFPGNEVGAVPVGQSFAVAAASGQVAQGAHDIATDGTDFIVVTGNTGTNSFGTDIYATRVSGAGAVLDATPLHLANDANGVAPPSVVFDGTDYVVVWIGASSSSSPGYGEVYAVRVAPDGKVLDTTPVEITNGAEAKFRPIGVDYDSADQNLLVAWRDQFDDIEAARFSTALADLDTASGFLVAARNGSQGGRFWPWVTFGGGVYLVVWTQGNVSTCSTAQSCTGNLEIAGARVSPAGQVLDPGGFTISSDPNNLQDYPASAFDGKNFLITWHDYGNSDAYNNGSGAAARVTPAGAVLDNPAITVASRELWEAFPQPVFDGTNYFVTWHVDEPEKFRLADVFGTRISPSGQVLDQEPSPVATGIANQFGPSVAFAGGKFLVVWDEDSGTSARCGFDHCVFGQILKDSTNAGTARAQVTPPTTSPDNWSVSATQANISLQTVFGLDDSHVYTSGEASGPPFYEFDGTKWSSIASPGRDHLYGIWGPTPSSLWATGWCTEFLQLDLSMNSFSDAGCTSGAAAYFSVWGSNPDNVFAVGSNSGLSTPLYGYYDGKKWNSPNGIGVSVDMASVWGTGAESVYAVGEYGTILHYDGSTWTPVSGVPTVQRLNGVWAASDSDVFAVGDFGTVVHYDGTSWTAQSSGVTDDLTGVWGFNGSDVYAVGLGGRILHWDGTSWTAEASPTTENLTAVTGAGNSVWAVGDAGAILRLVTTGNPTPEIASISPDSAPPTQDATIQVNGKNFVSGSTVRWNGSDVSTAFVSSTQLTATIPQSDLSSAFPGNSMFPGGWGEITVSSPAPQGGISSGLVLAVVPPGFQLSASPGSVSVAQGASATSTITVAAVGGFSGAVTLSATGLPSGVTASFAAGTSSETQVVTFNASTSAAVTSAPVTVTITGSSGTLTATTTIDLSITAQPGFTAGSGGTTTLSTAAGGSSTGTIDVVGTNGFSGTVNLSCKVTTSMANVNDLPSCGLNPAAVTLSGTTAQTSTLTVTTTAASSAQNQNERLFWPSAGGTALALILIIALPKRRRDWPAMMGIVLLLVCIGATGCSSGAGGGGGNGGGGGGGGNAGTTPGNYTITVTGTSGTLSATVATITLTVQ